MRLDPKFLPPISNLAGAFMALNRYGEASATLKEGMARRVGFNGGHRIAYLLAFIGNDPAAMSEHLNVSTGLGRTNAAFGWAAHVSAFGGAISSAHEQFRRGVQMSHQGGFQEVARNCRSKTPRPTRSSDSARKRRKRLPTDWGRAATTSRSNAPAGCWRCARRTRNLRLSSASSSSGIPSRR
jgi:hypothetical protein